MKKMRKIIPALAMLLVSAVMMSTASFAWFTMSAAVAAQGMSVRAIADGGLVMSAAKTTDSGDADEPGANDYASFVDFSDSSKNWYTNGATAIKPASVNNGTWYTATATGQDTQAAITSTYQKLTGTEFTTGSDYYLASKLYFKAAAEGTTNKLNVTDIQLAFANTATGSAGVTNRNLDKAIRVAMKCGNAWYYFAPNQTSGTFYYTGVVSTNNDGGTTVETYGPVTNSALNVGRDFTDVTLTSALTSTDAVEVEIYIYYEGEDENCKSANAVDIQTITVTANFACVKITTP